MLGVLGESSTCWRAMVNLRAGEISTSGAAQIGRYVPRRSAPLVTVVADDSDTAGLASEPPAGIGNSEAASRDCQRTPRPPISSSVSPP